MLTIACLAVGTLLVAVLALWITTTSRSGQLRRHFEAEAEASRARVYERVAPSPGWEIEPGRAAELYEAAWDQCESWPEAAETSLRQVRRALVGSQGLAGSSVRPPGAREIPGACVDAGVSADSEDLVLAQLDEELCALLVSCAPALAQTRQGTRREDTTSPVGIWSEFVLADGGAPRPLAPAMQLGQLMLLQAHVDGANGDRTAHLDGIFAVMRLGHDVAQGSAMVGAMVGIALRDRASLDLQWLLQRDLLTPDQTAYAGRQLAYVTDHPLSAEQALRDELLVATAMWASPARAPVTALEVQGARWTLTDRVVIGLASKDLLQMWEEILAIQAQPYPDRARQYPRVQQKALTSAIAGLQPDYGQFDARITVAGTRLLLLQLAAADARYRLLYERDPEDLEELIALDPQLTQRDPLSGEAFVLELRGDDRYLSSTALGARSRASLGLGEIAGGIHPETYLEIRLPSFFSETNTSSD